MNNRLISFLCTLFLIKGSLFGQSIDSALSVYNAQNPQEKIHIHFDKDAYLPGETVWMKAYLMTEAKPSDLSKNLYFDWTDVDGRLLLHCVAPIKEGGASSYFKIPAWVKNGVVHLKAYTQWMLNYDNAFLYNKDIPVLMPAEANGPVIIKEQILLNFFPEGGDLVSGVSSQLAFEALDQFGRPVALNGVLKNAGNTIIDSFHTQFNGMGKISFKPLPGETYRAYWVDENGDSQNMSIPPARANGLVMHVDPYHQGQLHYKLEKSADASKLTNIVIVGVINQHVVYRNSQMLENRMAEGTLNAADFPCGVLQLTAFDQDMSPLAERVVFVNNEKSFGKIQLKKDQLSLEKRARNEFSVEIPDSLVTHLSVSVTDAGLGYDSSHNIYSDLLIAGDLKGVIPDAASLLGNPANADENLDLLLLTHGWRRFNWDAVVSGKFPELKYPRDAGFLSVKGEIRDNPSPDVEDSMALLLITRDKKKQVLKLPVQDGGKFGQDGLFFYDSVQVVYQFNHASKLSSNTQISVFSGLLSPLTPARADQPAFAWMKVPDVVLEKEMNGNLIETRDFSVPSTAMSYALSPKTDSMGKNSENAAHYLADNFVDLRFPSTLKENHNGTDARLTSFKPATIVSHANVNVTLDGTPVAMDDLKAINMKEILFIKFLPKSGLKGLPTLAITSRQAQDQARIMDNKTGFAVITGYTPIREFYQVHYQNSKIEDYQASDFRTTLYWNPELRLDRTHRKTSFSFYNNDISNKFRIVIEGMNQEGKLCRIEETIK